MDCLDDTERGAVSNTLLTSVPWECLFPVLPRFRRSKPTTGASVLFESEPQISSLPGSQQVGSWNLLMFSSLILHRSPTWHLIPMGIPSLFRLKMVQFG